jgi:hypothetical protein
MVAIQSTPSEWAKLDAAQKRIVESSIRDMRLSGVGLDGADRDRFKVRPPTRSILLVLVEEVNPCRLSREGEEGCRLISSMGCD